MWAYCDIIQLPAQSTFYVISKTLQVYISQNFNQRAPRDRLLAHPSKPFRKDVFVNILCIIVMFQGNGLNFYSIRIIQ